MNCKLTDTNGQTHGGCQWGEGVRNTATGEGIELCSDGVIHYYADPLLAVFANPRHGDYDPATMILWEFTPDSEVNGDALKKGCKAGMTVKQIPLPEITTEQRVEIGIRAAKAVYKDQKWNEWADAWLSGEDRTRDAAEAATEATAEAAAWAARAAAGDAAEDAAHAAWAAAHAAAAADAGADDNIEVLAIIKQMVEE